MKLLLIPIFMSHASKNLFSWAHTMKLEHMNNNPDRPAIRKYGGRQAILSEGQKQNCGRKVEGLH